VCCHLAEQGSHFDEIGSRTDKVGIFSSRHGRDSASISIRNFVVGDIVVARSKKPALMHHTLASQPSRSKTSRQSWRKLQISLNGLFGTHTRQSVNRTSSSQLLLSVSKANYQPRERRKQLRFPAPDSLPPENLHRSSPSSRIGL